MLADTAYGKSGVRLVQVARPGDRHAIRDLTIGIRFEGDYDACYVEGDNTDVLPTDTMKNTVYALAAREPLAEPEHFGVVLGEHFLDGNPRVRRVTIDMREQLWGRITVDGREHGQAFVREGPESRTAHIRMDRLEVQVHAGLADLVILKSAGSAFAGFKRDELTTLAETRDRLLATALTATWRYDSGTAYAPAWHAVRRTLLDTFANHDSQSVQHTLYAMARAVLDAIPDVADIHLLMPNRHHVPVDLSSFGLPNRNEVFVSTDEPHGVIQATLRRS
jgi:urate oxidase